MKNYYRIFLGKNSIHAQECFSGGFVGAEFNIQEDLTGKLPEQWRDFNQAYIPVYLENKPEKTRIAAGWPAATFGPSAREFRPANTLLCPTGKALIELGVTIALPSPSFPKLPV